MTCSQEGEHLMATHASLLPAALDEDGGDTFDGDDVGARVIAGLS